MFVVKTMLGLGDAIYAHPIVKRLAELNDHVKVITKYPIVFQGLRDITAVQSASTSINVRLRYKHPNAIPQYTDMLKCVPQVSHVPFKFNWPFNFTAKAVEDWAPDLLIKFHSSEKKLCVIKEPCANHVHKNMHYHRDHKKLLFSMAPNVNEVQQWVDDNRDKYFFVAVGDSELHKLPTINGIDFDLLDRTSIHDFLCICAMADAIATQVGHLVPIAQSMGKPLKIFWPENVIDHRFKSDWKVKTHIEGFDNYL